MSDYKKCELVFKRTHPNAVIPDKKRETDSGFDVYSVEDKIIPARGSAVVEVGLLFAYITPNFWVRVEGRSGLGWKHGIVPQNGIIDNEYRGDASIKLYNKTDVDYKVVKGDRIAQFVVYPAIKAGAYEGDVEDSDRGALGFGSSGR